LANTLSSLLSSDNDLAVLDAAAEVIGHAYDVGPDGSHVVRTPQQVFLRELLYGTRVDGTITGGKIGAIRRAQDVANNRSPSEMSKDPISEQRKFYFGETVRKNWEDLEGANLQNMQLPGIHLYQANAQYINLHNAELSNAQLFGSDFQHGFLGVCHLRNSDLHEAKLQDADLYKADLTGANLKNAHLERADLRRAQLENADLDNANLDQAKVLTLDDLKGIKGRYSGQPIVLPDKK
jgi:uncharacterized protein YjbI with pentapeptide repeats